MLDVVSVLKLHAARYPLLQPQDAVKLLYQRAFGCGHLLGEEAGAFLREELARTPAGQAAPLWEPVGGGFCRLSLARAKAVFSPELIERLFRQASRLPVLGESLFRQELEEAAQAARAGAFPFSGEAFAACAAEYQAAGRPIPSHSEPYRQAYAPAYRLADSRLPALTPLLEALEQRRREGKRTLLALEGNAAGGKTTAAGLLAELYGAPVIHMDSFFLPPALRTPQRYAQPGGNIHYERFLPEAAVPLQEGRPFSYRLFDCSLGDYAGEAQVPAAPLTVVEGVYSLHPKWASMYHLKAFFALSPQEQQRRVLARNGEQGWAMFQQKWIPLENEYFSSFHIPESCDFVLHTGEDEAF